MNVENVGAEKRAYFSGDIGDLREGDGIEIRVAGNAVPVRIEGNRVLTGEFAVPEGRSTIELIETLVPVPAPLPDPRMVGVLWREISIHTAE